MLHSLNRLTFWPHHAFGLLMSFTVVAAVRVFSLPPDTDMTPIVYGSFVRTLISYVFCTAGAEAALRFAPERLPFAAKLVLGCLAAFPILGFVAPVINWTLGTMPVAVVNPGESREWLLGFIIAYYPYRVLGYAAIGAPIWCLVNLPWYQFQAGVADALASPAPKPAEEVAERRAADAERPPRFVAKLPHAKRGPVWAVTAEQHYLRIYTTRGDDLVLMRFSDALDELRIYEGLQIHRSHWVAGAAVKGLVTEGARLFVLLKNGVKLPVSRPNYAAAKAAFGDMDAALGETADA